MIAEKRAAPEGAAVSGGRSAYDDLSSVLSSLSLGAKRELLAHYEARSAGLEREAKALKEGRIGERAGEKERAILKGRAAGYRGMAEEMLLPGAPAVAALDAQARDALSACLGRLADEAARSEMPPNRMDLLLRDMKTPLLARSIRERKTKNLPPREYFRKVGEESSYRILVKRLGRMVEREESLKA